MTWGGLRVGVWRCVASQVEELRGEMRVKEIELEDLKRTSVQTLWRRDLDALLEALDKLVRIHTDVQTCTQCRRTGCLGS